MRWLDVRRHSLTKKGESRGRGSQLSQAGVDLAADWHGGPYDRVVTSDVPRALETALAMGCAVDDTVQLPGWYSEPTFPKHAQWQWDNAYTQLAARIQENEDLAAVAAVHLRIWIDLIAGIDDGSSALFIGHGGAIELTLVAALPEAKHSEWGAPMSHADAVRLGFLDGRFTSASFFRSQR